MPAGSQPSNEFQALLWSTCVAWQQSQMKWETEGDDGKEKNEKEQLSWDWKKCPLYTYIGIVYYPHTTMGLYE